MICPQSITAIVCDHPTNVAIVEVRPSIRRVTASSDEIPDSPIIASTAELRPQIIDTTPPDIQTGGDIPTIVESADLRPIIRRAEEED